MADEEFINLPSFTVSRFANSELSSCVQAGQGTWLLTALGSRVRLCL